MKRRIRNILFTAFALFFLAVGGYLILVAQGFVVDFKELKIEKTGAIFLKFTPRDAAIFIDYEETGYKQSGFLDSGGAMIKKLRPGEYRVKVSKDNYQDWEKTLEVQSGLIASASNIRLWPEKPAETTLIEENAKNFWLTEKGIVYENLKGEIIFNELLIRGGEVSLANAKSKLLVTKEGSNYFLIDLEEPRSAVNLTHLFNSLKQRQLALPGIVPVTDVFFHPFSSNKLVLASKTSLYAIDTKKVEIERFITLESIKSAKLSANDAFIFDDDGNLIIVNLLLRTSSTGAVNLGAVEDFKIKSDGTSVFILTAEGELKAYRRSSGEIRSLTTEARNFLLSPEEKRIAVITSDNKLKIAYPEKFEGNTRHEAGEVVAVPAVFEDRAENLSWPAGYQNYLLLLAGNNLMAQETDAREPANSHLLFREVLDYRLDGKNLYILKESGELITTLLN
jgi:hypothetical protein